MVKHHVKTKRDVGWFDRFVLLVAIAEPLSTVPQIYEVFATRRAESVSLLSWLLFAGASVVWLIYGIRIKSSPLIASSVLWISTEVVLIAGIIMYS